MKVFLIYLLILHYYRWTFPLTWPWNTPLRKGQCKQINKYIDISVNPHNNFFPADVDIRGLNCTCENIKICWNTKSSKLIGTIKQDLRKLLILEVNNYLWRMF